MSEVFLELDGFSFHFSPSGPLFLGQDCEDFGFTPLRVGIASFPVHFPVLWEWRGCVLLSSSFCSGGGAMVHVSVGIQISLS